MSDVDDDPRVPRSPLGCLVLFVPIVLTAGGVFAYLVMFGLGIYGRAATGDRVRVEFAGCAEAEPLVRDRVDLMGLGEPVFEPVPGGFALTATLPADPTDAQAIPGTLARTGRLEIHADRVDGAVVVAGERVDASTVHLGTAGVITLVRLDGTGADQLRDHMIAHPEGRIVYVLDGEKVYERSNLPAEALGNLEIETAGPDERTQMRVAAARSVILDAGPLPCPVEATRTVRSAGP